MSVARGVVLLCSLCSLCSQPMYSIRPSGTLTTVHHHLVHAWCHAPDAMMNGGSTMTGLATFRSRPFRVGSRNLVLVLFPRQNQRERCACGGGGGAFVS
jgi:hypothetical protein